MRFPRLVLVSISIGAGVVLSGCSSTSVSNTSSPTPTSPAPSVVALGMQDNGVAPNRWQYVQFNEAMDGSTINAQTFVVTDASDKPAAGNVVYYPNFDVAGFQPNPALQENASYTLTITTGVASAQGVHLAKAYSASFTTRDSTDTSPLYVKSVTPAPNATCVSASAPITITFSEGVDVSTLTSTDVVITGPGGAVIAATITYDVSTAVATITPASPLPSGTITVTVKSVADAAGVAMTAPYGWTFDTSCTSGSSVAYVYVTTASANSGPYQINGYAADANGQLTPVPGSPFQQSVDSMAASGTYLMASANTTPDINTYVIEPDGSLSLSSQFDYTSALGYSNTNSNICSGVGGLVFDRAGQSLYGEVFNIQCSNNNAVASFAFDSSNGSVSYLGNVNIGYDSSGQIAFLSNDLFAYSALNDSCMYGGINSFARAGNGNLTGFLTVATPPYIPGPPGATSAGVSQPVYRAGLTTTDNGNHVVMVEYPCFAVDGTVPQQPQLAIYSTDSSGHLSTTDTYATMPTSSVQTPQQMKVSPSGTLLAVGGYSGLQVFHLNGANPITSDTGLLTTDNITAVAWDNHNHLYAITADSFATSPLTNPDKLYVFTVTDTGATQAPGSPYTITFPGSIAVKSN